MNYEALIEEVRNFNEHIWHTPDTYMNFKVAPDGPGVYMFVAYKTIYAPCAPEVVYIGSSKNLYHRSKGHNILRFIERDYEYHRFYFKEIENYREAEIALIKAIHPRFNLQHTRG